ncbi:MAB_1171c family putative transporter [Streptomyces violens]|uniref:MAB_1171c family putative transporter n=1 Tax=Streptomyces violens TaxID=66377 RepID=UPI0004C25D25|nr:MAB_1171c family putative transporter [Streptomyces violens]
MKDILHPLCLAIAGSGFLFLLRDLAKSRRDRALVALAFTYGFSAISYAVSLTWVWVRIDGVFGITNISVPLAQSCVILVFALQATVLAYWSKPAAEARRRSRLLLIAAAVVIAGMAVLFALLTPATTRPADFATYYAHDPYYQAYVLLYFGMYTVAELYLARSCWKYARTASNPSITWGLRLITVGAIITLGYSTIRIGAVVGAEAGFGVEHLDPFAWACGDIGATATQIGYFLPTLARRTAAARDWTTAHLRYRQLRHLWAALDRADPGIALRRPAPHHDDLLRGRSAHFPLLRRRVEIRQGQKLLRRYLDPAARGESETRHRAAGRTGADLAAAVTADQIRAALLRHRANDPLETPAEYADAELPLTTTEDELTHLQRVASYFTPPAESPHAATSHSTTTGARS